MQRCWSIFTIPSGRFLVAWVGHTRTHGGLSQWLQSTRTFLPALPFSRYGWDSAAKVSLKDSFQIHLISRRGSLISGTLCATWQASMHARQSSRSRHFLTFTAMGHRPAGGSPGMAPVLTAPATALVMGAA